MSQLIDTIRKIYFQYILILKILILKDTFPHHKKAIILRSYTQKTQILLIRYKHFNNFISLDSVSIFIVDFD